MSSYQGVILLNPSLTSEEMDLQFHQVDLVSAKRYVLFHIHCDVVTSSFNDSHCCSYGLHLLNIGRLCVDCWLALLYEFRYWRLCSESIRLFPDDIGLWTSCFCVEGIYSSKWFRRKKNFCLRRPFFLLQMFWFAATYMPYFYQIVFYILNIVLFFKITGLIYSI